LPGGCLGPPSSSQATGPIRVTARPGNRGSDRRGEEHDLATRASLENENQYEALKDKGMSGSGGNSSQGGKATAKKS